MILTQLILLISMVEAKRYSSSRSRYCDYGLVGYDPNWDVWYGGTVYCYVQGYEYRAEYYSSKYEIGIWPVIPFVVFLILVCTVICICKWRKSKEESYESDQHSETIAVTNAHYSLNDNDGNQYNNNGLYPLYPPSINEVSATQGYGT